MGLFVIQWNLDLTKSLGTGQICSLNGGFVISRFFLFYCNFDRDIISFVISRTSLNRGSLNRGSTVHNVRRLCSFKIVFSHCYLVYNLTGPCAKGFHVEQQTTLLTEACFLYLCL